MADNTTLDPGTGGDIIATDDLAGVKYQRVKVNFGADGSATDVSSAAPLPIDSELTTVDADTGAGTDTRASIVLVRAESGGGVLVGSANPLPTNQTAALPAGTNNIGDVDVLSLPAIPAGTNNIGDVDVLTVPSPLSTAGGGTEATALRVTVANDSTGLVSVDDNGGSLTVDGTVTANLAAGTNNIGDVDVLSLPGSLAGIADDATFSVASSVLMPVGFLADQASTDSVNEGDIGAARITLDRKLIVTVAPSNDTEGLDTSHLVSAASTNATVVKASAGKLFGWYIYNSNAAARKVAFHNSASSPTAGASIFFTVVIPPTAGANVEFTNGITFSTGIAFTTVTGLADSDSTAVAANDLIINLWYK